MKFKLLIIPILLACYLAAVPASASTSVMTEVKKTVDEVINILADKELKKAQNEKKRRAALKSTIGSLFDYREMTQRAMGVHWRNITPEQKDEITKLFENLLENTYANKIESYNNEKVNYRSENVDNDYAEVKTTIISAKKDEYTVNYRLLNESGSWRVYDVVIEGVSLVSNYRSQFNKIMNSKGVDELLNKLRSKSKEIKNL